MVGAAPASAGKGDWRRRLRTTGALLGLFSVLAASAQASDVPRGKVALGISAAIETSRFQTDHRGEAVFFSPDRSRYVVFVVTGDAKRNGVWLTVLSGGTASAGQARPHRIAHLFTDGKPKTIAPVDRFGPYELLTPDANSPSWLDNRRIVFLWEDALGRNQIFSLDVNSGALRQITRESASISAFEVGAHGALAYDVEIPYSRRRSEAMYARGFSVKSRDASALLAGFFDDTSIFDTVMCRRGMAIETAGKYAAKSLDARQACDLSPLYYGGRIIAPDGRHMIVNAQVSSYPDGWSIYGAALGTYLRDARRDPRGSTAEAITKLLIVDLATGKSRDLWDVPASVQPWSMFAWSPDSRAVVIAPTLLPIKGDVAALGGHAFAIVNAQTGRYLRLAIATDIADNVMNVTWPKDDLISLGLRDGRSVSIVNRDGVWTEAASAAGLPAAPGEGKIGVDEGLNQPPVLVGRFGKVRTVLYDPNADLRNRFSLGPVKIVAWTDSQGYRWHGRLYLPASYHPGTRYPIVIQTHGYAGSDRYSLYGQGYPGGGVALGPGWSVYLAQPLASRDIAVLQLGGADNGAMATLTGLEYTKRFGIALTDAAQNLVNEGLVDRTRVGIMGHSAMARNVEQALVFSDFPFAAAISADGYEFNYAQSMLFGWAHEEGMPAPFGRDLQNWLDRSPAWNAERIRTPLQLELTSGGAGNQSLLWSWEMFSRLRYLQKPVEYYVMPDVLHGSHLVQNPGQLLALQTRALDWWLFWLKDVVDPAPSKIEQYRDWAALKVLRDREARLPRPPLLHWFPR
ncbi:MAG: prolyl oligopeptidase family serine peptidase [Rhizomicrobium sp.]